MRTGGLLCFSVSSGGVTLSILGWSTGESSRGNAVSTSLGCKGFNELSTCADHTRRFKNDAHRPYLSGILFERCRATANKITIKGWSKVSTSSSPYGTGP